MYIKREREREREGERENIHTGKRREKVLHQGREWLTIGR
jgi:hypothetical protein